MIPLPVDVKNKELYFVLSEDTQINCSSELNNLKKYLLDIIKKYTTFFSKKILSKENNTISIQLDKELLVQNPEGYLLNISKENIKIQAREEVGVFYGIQTLRQLIAGKNNNKISCIDIVDYPRFPWRGFMFDSGRHFHNIETIKWLIEVLASLKFNIFHWHLTDDQGWRIEIDNFPKLVEIGSKRLNTKIGGWTSNKYRNVSHEGYYSKEDIREIIQFANERFIQIIPEIEMPGHSRAAIASYPVLGCQKKQIEVAINPGIYLDVLCAGRDFTYEFLKKVLKEIVDLFPSQFIHIGGDEVPKKRWKKCSDCKKKIAELGLKDLKGLKKHFFESIVSYLDTNNRKTIAWNEILQNVRDKDIIAQWWMSGKRNVKKHLLLGGKVIVSNFFHYYLDYNYIVTPLKKTYSYEPIPRNLKKRYHNQIIGIEAPLWTEWVPNRERLEWQLFPRLFAIAETAWTQKRLKNYNSFIERLRKQNIKMDEEKINYAALDEVNPSRLKRLLRFNQAFKWPEE